MSVKLNFILDGQNINSIVEWEDTEIEINFINNQPEISIEQFTFVDKAADILINWINAGCNGGPGIFEGVPLDVIITCGNFTHTFNLYVDLADESNIVDGCSVIAKVKVCDSIETLDECLQANSFDYLRELDPVGYDACCMDVPYIVEKIDYGLELAFLSFATFIALYQTVEAGRMLVVSIIDLTSVQSAADILRGVLRVIANAIFFAAMLIHLINLIKELIDYIYPPVRTHKAIRMVDLLKKAIEHCGYKLKIVGISEADCLTYLPSKPNKNTPNDKCVPLPAEGGYFFKGMFDIFQKLFKTERFIKDGCVYIYPEIDETLLLQSTYIMPSTLNEVVKYDTGSFKATNLMQFLTDLNDGWTVVNYEGNAFQRRYRPITTQNSNKVLLNGLNECNIPVALGSKKTELSVLEKALKSFLTFADGLIGVFGGNTTFSNVVTRRLCMLKVENTIHSVPKLLATENDGKLKANHRNILSAPALFKKYHGINKQYGVVEDLEIDFCCDDFEKVLCNHYFYDCDGRKSKFVSLKWNWSSDKATISYKYETKYTNNLTQTDVTPE